MPKTPRQNNRRRARYNAARESGLSAKESRASANRGGSGEAARQQEFEVWSEKNGGGFPPNHLRDIERYNRSHRRTSVDHLGYRWFYWKYVFGLDDKAIRKQLKDNDS